MRAKIVLAAACIVVLVAGVAVAGHRTRTNDITTTFDVERVAHKEPRTCAGVDGGAYVERTDLYRGEMYSEEDPRLAGDLQIEAHTLIDTNTGDGITVAKVRLFDETGREKFNGGYSATLDRFEEDEESVEGLVAQVTGDEGDNFAEGFWFSKVKGVGGEGDDNEGPTPAGLLAANVHINIVDEMDDPTTAGMIAPHDDGRQGRVDEGDESDSGELGQETHAEEWEDEPDEGEDNDEDNPAIVQTGSCTDFSDWDNDWVG